jgi:hypothetical protein
LDSKPLEKGDEDFILFFFRCFPSKCPSTYLGAEQSILDDEKRSQEGETDERNQLVVGLEKNQTKISIQKKTTKQRRIILLKY